MLDIDLLERAKEFAIAAHGTQTRKYTGHPYWYHLRDVARTLIRYSAKSEVVAAGWLHDTLEDTPVTYDQLERHFGPVIADLVLQVTDVSRVGIHGTRTMRKRLDRQYLAGASAEGQMIKCADTISNTPDIVAHDLRFAREAYVPEKRALIGELRNARATYFAVWSEAEASIRIAELAIINAAA